MKLIPTRASLDFALTWNGESALLLPGTFWFSSTQDNRQGFLHLVDLSVSVTAHTHIETAYNSLSFQGWVAPVGGGELELQYLTDHELGAVREVILGALREKARELQADLIAKGAA